MSAYIVKLRQSETIIHRSGLHTQANLANCLCDYIKLSGRSIGTRRITLTINIKMTGHIM